MLQELSKADYGGRITEYDADTLRWLTYILIFCWALCFQAALPEHVT